VEVTAPTALCLSIHALPSSSSFEILTLGIVRLFSLLAFATICACHADAQPGRRSPRSTITQTVNGTEISIRYYRPVLRGRTPFPDVVSWGRTWTPGADSATRLETTGALDIEGHTLPAGKYSVWVVPQEKDAWMVIFNRTADAFHLSHDESQDALRVQARVATSPQSVETLQFSFPMVDADSALLELQWGTFVLPLKLHAR
jgi:hypothetical protein